MRCACGVRARQRGASHDRTPHRVHREARYRRCCHGMSPGSDPRCSARALLRPAVRAGRLEQNEPRRACPRKASVAEGVRRHWRAHGGRRAPWNKRERQHASAIVSSSSVPELAGNSRAPDRGRSGSTSRGVRQPSQHVCRADVARDPFCAARCAQIVRLDERRARVPGKPTTRLRARPGVQRAPPSRTPRSPAPIGPRTRGRTARGPRRMRFPFRDTRRSPTVLRSARARGQG